MSQKKTFLFTFVAFCLAIAVLAIIAIVANFNQSSSVSLPSTPPPPAEIRQPAVAGQFYPQDSPQLNNQLNTLLAQTELLETEDQLRILIVPHAGLDYSGRTAAQGFKQITKGNFSRFILLGASHKLSFNHAAVYQAGRWQTPLGLVAIDQPLASALIDSPQQIIADSAAHAPEHSLEVEVIFLQKLVDNFTIVPILLSQPSDELIENLAHKIVPLLDDQTLLVISTDLSHYPAWEIANQVDQQTITAILSGKKENLEKTVSKLENASHPNLDTCACGYQPLRVALRIAELLNISSFKNINYENSGDVVGNKNRVVGYAAIGAWSDELKLSYLNQAAQEEALQIARQTLTQYLNQNQTPSLKPHQQDLFQSLGAFVTLKKHHQLRGCIGSFQPNKPLFQVIQEMVIAAATQDQRFPKVTPNELSDISIEISVMTPKRKISNWQEIILGEHGVVIEKNHHSGTFLPQVALESGWSREEFLRQLCTQKAGLTPDCYQDPGVNLYLFEAQVFEEKSH